MDFNQRFREKLSNSRFCYAKEGGQGFVDKSECTCDRVNNPCQAILDSEKFHDSLKGLEYGDFEHRDKLIEKINPELKDSQWYKDNVKE